MSCSDCGGSCRPNRCVGITAAQFPVSTVLTSGKAFRMTDDTQIIYQTLLNSVQASIIQNPIVRVYASSPTYLMTGNEDVVWCTGDVVVTLALTANGNRVAHFNAEGGTISFVAQAGETHSISNITTGNATAIGGNANTMEWREL